MTYFSKEAEPTPKTVGFVAFDGIRMLDLLGPLEAFSIAREPDERRGEREFYKPMLVALNRRNFRSAAGTCVQAHHTFATAPPLDTIVVPGGPELRNSQASRDIAAWIFERAPATRRIASVAAGIYPLASTGLLNDRQVTTHWRIASDVARSFPRLRVTTTASFVKDGTFYTAGGGTAGTEMALTLIQDDHGVKTAIAVARELVMDLRPATEPGRPIELPQYQPGAAERLAELPAWITSRLRQDLSVEVLAERVSMCPRQFYRVFKRTFKSTPAEFVERLRIDEAERRLASLTDSIELIATSVGFKSPEVLRRAFGRQRGVPLRMVPRPPNALTVRRSPTHFARRGMDS